MKDNSTELEQRDKTGRFVKGHKGGPGNPFAAQVNKLRRELLNSVTPKQMQRICRKLVAMAEYGDLAAIKILFAYTVGKPISIDVEHLTGCTSVNATVVG